MIRRTFSALWTVLNGASVLLWLWAIGGSVIVTAVISGLLHLGWPYNALSAVGLFVLCLGAVLGGAKRIRECPSKSTKTAAEALDELIAESWDLIGVPSDAPALVPPRNEFRRDMQIRYRLREFAPQYLPLWMDRDTTHPVDLSDPAEKESIEDRESREDSDRARAVRRDIDVLSEFRRDLRP
jgi:hypothetical protein